MFARLARLVSRRPRWVLGAWLLLLGLSLPFAARVGEVLTAQPDLAQGEAVEVQDTLREAFDGGEASSVVMWLRADPNGSPTENFVARVEDTDGVTGVRNVADLVPGSVAAEGERLLQLTVEERPERDDEQVVRELRALADAQEDLTVAFAGGPATVLELERTSERDTVRGELYGLPVSLLVLIVAFGALVAAGLPLLVATASVTLSLGALYLLGGIQPFAVFTQSVVTMLGLATGIDYALLMVNRFREELREGTAPRQAAEATAGTAGKAVAFSGLTVIVALAALLVPPLPYIQSIGVGTIVVLSASVLVSWTALPALLALLGRRVNWIRIGRGEPGTRTRGFWRARAERIMERPLAWALVGSALLVLLALPALGMRVADPGPLGLARGTESRTVVSALDRAGLGGLLEDVTVLLDLGEDGFYGPSAPRDVAALAREVGDLDGVRAVLSPFSAPGVPNLLLFQYYIDRDLARDSEVGPLARSTISSDGRYVRLQVVPTGSLGPDASADLEDRIRALAAGRDFTTQLGGSAAYERAWSNVLYRSFPLALGLVYLATLVLLGIAFRSVLIPVKSILLNTLTIGASYGVITLIFQHGWGAGLLGLDGGLGFVDGNAPLFIFAIVFGLSMDYEVFLVARMYEAHRQGMDDRAAVISALAATGGVITSAATVMLVVFSVFFFSDLVLIKTLGVGLAVAIFLDATVVRVALVPAVMALAGRWNWWLPGPLRRLADRFDRQPDA